MYRGPQSGGILGFPPAISQLVLVNAVVFLSQQLLPDSFLYRFPSGQAISGVPAALGLVPHQVVAQGMIWQLVTYMFLHGGLMHVLFNMFGLVVFGSELERWWGSREFLKYYFITGIGAGLCQVASTYIFDSNPYAPIIGASGALFGVIIAFGMAFPHRQILLWFVIPVSARTLVAIYAFIELAATAQYRGGDGVARYAHLGGMLVGWIYLKQDTLFWRVKRWFGKTRSSWERSRQGRGGGGEAAQARMDAILDKISREGMGSLTDEERRILRESAERARKRQQGRDG